MVSPEPHRNPKEERPEWLRRDLREPLLSGGSTNLTSVTHSWIVGMLGFMPRSPVGSGLQIGKTVMAMSEEDLQNLLADPHESLDLELKQWIDPSSPEGTAKIARACIALWNNNGGRLVIGFTDEGRPDVTNVPNDVRKTFHVDVIQAIVGRYSAEQFSIEVNFVERGGQPIPSSPFLRV